MGQPIFSPGRLAPGKNGPAHFFLGEKTDWGEFRPVTPGR